MHERNSLQRQRVLRSLSPRLGPSFDVSSSTTDEEEEKEEEEASEFIDLHAPARRAALERTERKEGRKEEKLRLFAAAALLRADRPSSQPLLTDAMLLIASDSRNWRTLYESSLPKALGECFAFNFWLSRNSMRSLCNDIPMHIAKMVEARSGSQHRRQSLPLSHSCLLLI